MTLHRDAEIDVTLRTGGRPFALLERAVRSLANQSAGAIRLLLVRHGPADVEALGSLVRGALVGIEVIDTPGANRAQAMAAGLARVSAPHFALLDDDDYLLDDHFLHLLEAAASVAAPAFAYCDILAQQEGAPFGASLRVWRAGEARPPLGRITDRMSVHAFLADRAALEDLPFERWNLATAEDALLVASLLARCTPVHTPHATCVYVQGRQDASAYLAHPDRAADELTFAREIAPWQAVIEAKFGATQAMDEETFLAPFLAAARHAALFADLERRPVGSGPAAIRNGTLTGLMAGDPALITARLPLAFEAVAGTVLSEAEGGVRIEAPQDFAYAARLPLDLVSPARPAMIAVGVTSAEGAFGLAVAGADGELVTEVRVEAAPVALEMQFPWERLETPLLIVRRLNALGAASSHIHIDSLSIGFPVDAVAAGRGKPEAQAVLAALTEAPRIIVSAALGGPHEGEVRPILDAVEIGLGDAPWAYVFSMPLPPEAATAGLRVDIAPATAPVFVLRVDEAWAAIGERMEAPAGSRPASLSLEPLAHGMASRLVVQAGPAPAGASVTLGGVFLYPAGDPAGAET